MGRHDGNRYLNRETSWLRFNERVLDLSRNGSIPLLERLKFLAISSTNLDEFFMVRVGGLNEARRSGSRYRDFTGLTPAAQLKILYEQTRSMMNDMHQCWDLLLAPSLQKAGIVRRPFAKLSSDQRKIALEVFTNEIFPVVSPMAVDPEKPLPFLGNLTTNVIVALRGKGRMKGKDFFAVIPLHRYGGRIVHLPSGKGFHFVLREDIVMAFLEHWFPGYEVRDAALFRITRNADFAVAEDEAPDLVSGMTEVLEERKTGACVRIEVHESAGDELRSLLLGGLEAEKRMLFPLCGPVDLGGLMCLTGIDGHDELKVDPWPSQPSVRIVPSEPMFDQIASRDLLLYHPYESYDPVIRFIREAAEDPDVLAIKLALYRTSSGSPIIEALRTAADNGINVTVLLELKARFDEARNIRWVKDLEPRGIQVIYGVKGFKTHAKICLVVRREPSGIRRYCHFATGNYNEITAKFYGDVSYFTADPELGQDASAFFNALCGYSQPVRFNRISMAPVNLREKLVDLIDAEIQRAYAGQKAAIQAKLNSLVDRDIIEKLYEASTAGVKIRLNVRGICCLIPGVKDMSENITVTAIVDRYLEHARILAFHHGGKPRVFITSADWMPRNLDRRLELLVPVEDPSSSARLLHILETHLDDTESSWFLNPDGTYSPLAGTGKKPLRSQEAMYLETVEENGNSGRQKSTRFKPHTSGKR